MECIGWPRRQVKGWSGSQDVRICLLPVAGVQSQPLLLLLSKTLGVALWRSSKRQRNTLRGARGANAESAASIAAHDSRIRKDNHDSMERDNDATTLQSIQMRVPL